MDKQKRKEIVAEYMTTRPDMGIYEYFCKETNKHYLGETQNMKATLNGGTFRLNAGNHKDEVLQADWKQYGEENFEVNVLEVLPYDKEDDAKTDYSKELALLIEKWSNKFENHKILR